MKIELWWIGKTQFAYLEKGIGEYVKRIDHYVNFTVRSLDDVKFSGKMKPDLLKKREASLVLDKLPKQASLVLLDENGKVYNSKEFSSYLINQLNYSSKTLIFLIGGAYGFDNELYKRADAKISLSKMTFSHQMVRLFFVEQLYRAFTIINNEKYHNH